METSWISRKGGILEKGGWPRKGGMTPLTNYGHTLFVSIQGLILQTIMKLKSTDTMTQWVKKQQTFPWNKLQLLQSSAKCSLT